MGINIHLPAGDGFSERHFVYCGRSHGSLKKSPVVLSSLLFISVHLQIASMNTSCIYLNVLSVKCTIFVLRHQGTPTPHTHILIFDLPLMPIANFNAIWLYAFFCYLKKKKVKFIVINNSKETFGSL